MGNRSGYCASTLLIMCYFQIETLSIPPSTGIHEIIVDSQWSLDYQGPLGVKAVGGYSGKFTCVELRTGLGLVYHVKGKLKHMAWLSN